MGTFAKVEADLTLLTWMVGINLVLTAAGFSLVLVFLWQIVLRLPGVAS